jgi:hypothetical protein
MHSQASFPRSVALAQLPSPSACSLEVVIWYTDLLEIPISHRGLEPNAHDGRTKAMDAKCSIGRLDLRRVSYSHSVIAGRSVAK